jgi:hypothetical protein
MNSEKLRGPLREVHITSAKEVRDCPVSLPSLPQHRAGQIRKVSPISLTRNTYTRRDNIVTLTYTRSTKARQAACVVCTCTHRTVRAHTPISRPQSPQPNCSRGRRGSWWVSSLVSECVRVCVCVWLCVCVCMCVCVYVDASALRLWSQSFATLHHHNCLHCPPLPAALDLHCLALWWCVLGGCR